MNDKPRQVEFSEDRAYRYSLLIRWDDGPLVQFIGLNPSTADEVADDPTIRRCKGFAKSCGGGGMVMTNLFAWRSTDPAALKKVPNPVGEDGRFISAGGTEFSNRNDLALWTTMLRCSIRIACWGTHGHILYRDKKVKQLLSGGLSCLAVTKDGFPKHPLYLKADLRPTPYPPNPQHP